MSPWAPNDFWLNIAAMVRLLQDLHWVYGPTLSGKTQERMLRGSRPKIEGPPPPARSRKNPPREFHSIFRHFFMSL